MDYQTIVTIKESEKSTILLAAVELYVGPVVVKKLKGGKPDIYHLLSQKSHPNISQVISVEETEDELLVVEEYVDGENLAEYLQKHYLSDEEKIKLALQLCDAVGFLHAMKPSVIHRDIKPSNILITEKRVLKLIDFDASRKYKDMSGNSDTRLLGTVEYAPPEQFGYAQTDVRSDIYSMGIVFHEMRPTENKRLTELWEKISEKCTSFDPKNRYQSVAELKREIEKLSEWEKRRKKKAIAGICGVAAACVLVGLVISLWSKQNPAEKMSGIEPESVVTEAPTQVVEPTAEPTETPTPVPTETLTPEPTETPTPEPTEKPSDIMQYMINRGMVFQQFYKGRGLDYMAHSTDFGYEGTRMTSVELYNYETYQATIVPQEYFFCENSIFHIKHEFIDKLEAGYYEVAMNTMNDAGRGGSYMTYVQVHEGADVKDEDSVIYTNYLDFEYNEFTYVSALLNNSVDSCFKDIGTYRVVGDGRIAIFDYEFLMQYMEVGQEGEVKFIVELEDGRSEELTVAYLN